MKITNFGLKLIFFYLSFVKSDATVKLENLTDAAVLVGLDSHPRIGVISRPEHFICQHITITFRVVFILCNQ
jgi:hypothetical protein